MNPWLILGVIAALAGSWWIGDRHGHSEENKTWTLSTQQSKLDYDKKLKVVQDAKEASEHAFSDLKDQTEVQHAQDVTDIADGKRRADELIAGGLRRAKSCNVGPIQPVPANSQPERGDAEGTAAQFYLLPESAPNRLRDRYAEADSYLSLYRACRTRLSDAIDKSKTAR